MVSKFPCIYDLSSPLHKELTVKDNAWRSTAESVGRTVEDCKKRWRNIKDTYQKRQKKRKSGSSSTKWNKWVLADMLTFLNEVDHKRESINVKGEETHSQEEDGEAMSRDRSQTPPTSFTNETPSQNVEDILSFRPPSKRARQNDNVLELLDSWRIERETILKTLAEEKCNDDVDLFFKSIASSVKKMSPNLINVAKMRSLQMVIDLEGSNSSAYNFPRVKRK